MKQIEIELAGFHSDGASTSFGIIQIDLTGDKYENSRSLLGFHFQGKRLMFFEILFIRIYEAI